MSPRRVPRSRTTATASTTTTGRHPPASPAPFGSSVQAAPAPSMAIQVLPKTGPSTITKPQAVKFVLKVSGIQLDATHMGKKNVAGQGHIQIYVDKIPADAYKVKDLKTS